MCEKSKGVYDMSCMNCCVRLLKSAYGNRGATKAMLAVIRMSKQAQWLLSAHRVIRNLFDPGRHQLGSASYRPLLERPKNELNEAGTA
jgi:hypothetical protein